MPRVFSGLPEVTLTHTCWESEYEFWDLGPSNLTSGYTSGIQVSSGRPYPSHAQTELRDLSSGPAPECPREEALTGSLHPDTWAFSFSILPQKATCICHLLLPLLLLLLPSHSSLSQPLEEPQVRSGAPLEQMEPRPGAPHIL